MERRNLRNIYENEELVTLSREQAENLLSNGIEVGYANPRAFYHGSEKDDEHCYNIDLINKTLKKIKPQELIDEIIYHNTPPKEKVKRKDEIER